VNHALGADPKTKQLGLPTPGGAPYTASTWSFVLTDGGPNQTRLLMRGRLDYNPPSAMNFLIWHVLTDPIGFVMMRRMMLGIQDRAEKLSQSQVLAPTTR